jgi:hypothetical protein
MLRKSNRWRLLVLIAGVVVGGIFVGGVVGGQFDVTPGDDFQASLQDDASVRVAEIPGEDGLPARSVFVQPTATGFLCLWDAASATAKSRQGGCNPADDPLAGRKLTISLAYDGGPAVGDVRDARLIGLASFEVSSVQVLMSDGTRRTIPMRREAAVASQVGRFRAFGYRFPRSDFRRGLGPRAVLALNAGGVEIDRLTTGFGG